ncbi:MAG: prolipoprotein diacylglyceryl transferase [Bdellovibrionales bacterium]|nr:prolipoprotein diacylglyceryl transferase [Bdellovibrionales bacterium]
MYPSIQLTDQLTLPSYLLVISLTYCLALLWLVKRADQYSMDRAMALDLALGIMLGGFLGARLFHVLYEEPAFYWKHPLELFKVWKGGFVFYGGAISAFLISLGIVLVRKGSVGQWADLFAPIGAFGYGLGRLGCLLNGCCFGKYCEYPWNLNSRHPTAAYASIGEFAILGLLLFVERRRNNPKSLFFRPGRIFLLWIGLHGISRLFMESLREDDRGPELFSLSISSWISIFLVALSLTGFGLDFFNSKRSRLSHEAS